MNEIRNRIVDLRKSLLLWSNAYYDKGEELVSNEVFDAAKLELKGLEEAYPELAEDDSPTQVVGDISEETKRAYVTAPHHVPMLSLRTEVRTTIEPIVEFLRRLLKAGIKDPYLTEEYKYDGLGLDLQYRDGKLDKAVTRGDGMVGEDVTHLVRFMSTEQIPLELPIDITMDVRGEVMMRLEDFRAINLRREAKGEKLYANPRNYAAGLLRMRDPVDVHKTLIFMAYDVPWGEGVEYEKRPNNYLAVLGFLSFLGFKRTAVNLRYPADGIDFEKPGGLEKAAECIWELYQHADATRAKMPFEVDGVVYKLNRLEYREKLGYTGAEPNWAIAHKFAAMRVNTELLDIETETGRTGRVTPVARVQAVVCGGVTVTNATLVHEQRIQDLGVSVGDTVTLQRAGDVIPEIVAVANKRNEVLTDTLHLFSSCPSCGSALVKEGSFYYCKNFAGCEAQLQALLTNAVARSLLNIKGLGEATVERLIENEDLKSVADIFLLTPEKLTYAGVAPSLVEGIMEHVRLAYGLPAFKVLAALGIRLLGPSTATDLLNHFGSLQKVFEADVNEMVKIHNIDTITAQRIRQGLDYNADAITAMLALPHQWTHSTKPTNGMTACCTGTLSGYTRESLKEALELAGFRVLSTVSKQLNVLIAGPGGGSKLAEATELNIPIVSDTVTLEALLRSPWATIQSLKKDPPSQ